MTKAEFLDVVLRWSTFWDEEQRRGEPGFGSESTLADWLGSVDAYGRIASISSSRIQLRIEVVGPPEPNDDEPTRH